jgi:type I restriction enzyme M protein
LPDIVEKWKNRKKQTENDRDSKFFYVDKKEIEKNDFDLSINRYKKTVYEEVKYDNPKVILAEIEKLEQQIVAGLKDLKMSKL